MAPARGSDTTVATGTLAAGTYRLTIEHAVPDVHNDLQLTLQGPGEAEARAIYASLRPLANHVDPAALLPAPMDFR